MFHGSWVDSPPIHGLNYFQIDPCSRIDPTDRLLQCSVAPSAGQIESRSKTNTKLRFVGKIGPLAVYDLEYNFKDNEIGMKSVLVGTNLNELHEIYVEERQPQGTLFPTELLTIGRNDFMKIKSDDGGMYHAFHEIYFSRLGDNIVLLDFTEVFASASNIVPSDIVTYQPTSRFDFKSLIFHIQTQNRDVTIGRKVACCHGRVEVHFKVKKGSVVLGKANYIE